MPEYQKVLPLINLESKPFWDAAKHHELALQKCLDCRVWYYPPGIYRCRNCGSSRLEWTKASGRGKVYTYNIFHLLYHPAYKDDIPYNTAIIELEEGPFMQSAIVQCKNEDIKIGMPVEVAFEDVTEEVSLPKFKPAS